jgi:hypothetical protein
MSTVHIYSPDDLKAGKAQSDRMSNLKKSRSQRDPGHGETLLMPREVSSFDGVKLPSVPTGDFKSFKDFLDEAFAKRGMKFKE